MVREVVQVVARLTGREAEVLRLIARGCTHVQEAVALGISAHTVGTHIKTDFLTMKKEREGRKR